MPIILKYIIRFLLGIVAIITTVLGLYSCRNNIVLFIDKKLQHPIISVTNAVFVIILIGLCWLFIANFERFVEITKSKNFKTIGELFKSYSLYILLGTSIPYVLCYLIYKHGISINAYEIDKTIWGDLYKLFLTILSSGIFLAVLKYLQFLNFFQEAIRDTIYSEEYLRNQSNIYKIWQKVTAALLKSELPPDIVEKSIKSISENFLKEKTLNHYYQNIDIRYTVSLDEYNHILIKEWMRFAVKNPDQNDFTFDFSYSLKKESSIDSITKILPKLLKINNVNEIENVVNGNEEIEEIANFSKDMNDSLQSYIVEQEFEFTQKLEFDREFYCRCVRIFDNVTITITNESSNLGIFFTEIGISTFTISSNAENTMIYKSEFNIAK